MEISGALWPFILIYKAFEFFFRLYVYKSLTRAPKLDAPKISKTMSKLL